jgi:formate/nitrite transporter FocA (FNT family)
MSLDLVLYRVLRASAVVTVLSLATFVFSTGGWEAAVAALAIAAGMAFSLSLVVLVITGEGTSDRARR